MNVQRTLASCALAAVLLAWGCRQAPADEIPSQAASTEAPGPLVVAADKTGQVFRYIDPATGAVQTATSVPGVPEAARNQVVVFDDQSATPPGWEHVADLSGQLPVTTTPVRGFVLRPVRTTTPIPSAAARSRRTGSHEVVLFSTRGCGYCTKARRYFEGRGQPYSEFDVERDPSAPKRLESMGKKAGVAPGTLRGVPIIFIDGKPMVGWDRKRVEALLGG